MIATVKMPRNSRLPFSARLSLVLCSAWSVAGCGSPPSVTPLLRAASSVMLDEASHVNEEQTRDTQQIATTRQSLDAAFAADLQQRAQLDPAWVTSAAQAYAAAREGLAKHEIALAQARQQRIANLNDAIALQERAVQVLEKQDQLLSQTLGVDLWRLDQSKFKTSPLGSVLVNTLNKEIAR